MHSPPAKSLIREKMLLKRESIAPDSHAAWSQECSERLYQAIKDVAPRSAIIAGYASIKSELNVLPALTLLAQAGHPLALPVMGKEDGRRQLTFHTWKPGDKLSPKTYGIHEPDNRENSIIPDIVIVPMLAFDRTGHRLGYGGGYYDTVLRKLRAVRPAVIAIGAAFGLQEEKALPTEPYDEILSRIVTEKEVISIR